MIKRIKREGDFLVNGKSQTVRCLLQKGDCLEIIFPIENSNIQPENIPLKIIYEDDYYIIIDKESQMPCIPTKRYQSHTVRNRYGFFSARVHEVNRFFLSATKKKETRKKGKGKVKRKLEKKEKQRKSGRRKEV